MNQTPEEKPECYQWYIKKGDVVLSKEEVEELVTVLEGAHVWTHTIAQTNSINEAINKLKSKL